ncbi:MAG: DnaD domain protein, partial [Oscillospiraceae bacterium]|nr:DnaD domain protein [Oscillospiraceae bacterium]
MGYRINYEIYKDVFSVPKSIVEKNLRVASVEQLKVILAALSSASITAEAISRVTGVSEYECALALDFWVERGILFSDNSAVQAADIEKKFENVSRLEKPSFDEVLKRAEESPEIADLLRQAQMALGRTISRSEQRSLVFYRDTYGLPYEVILLLLGYAKSIDKMNFGYIDKIAKDWGEKEINTYEKAEALIDKLVRTRQKEFKVRKALDLGDRKLTVTENRLIARWTDEFGYDVDILSLGYDKTVDGIGKLDMRYLDKILTSWYQNNVKTIEDAENLAMLE